MEILLVIAVLSLLVMGTMMVLISRAMSGQIVCMRNMYREILESLEAVACTLDDVSVRTEIVLSGVKEVKDNVSKVKESVRSGGQTNNATVFHPEASE